MKFFRRSKIGAASLILLSFPAALVWIVLGGDSVEAGLTSGTPVHSHSGTTTGGSTLTRPNLSNASAFTLSTADDTTDFAIATTGIFGKMSTSTTLGTVGLYLDAGNVTDDGVRSPRIANYSDGANVGFDLRTATVDATDNAIVRVCAAGDCTLGSRGARIALHGNETTSAPGRVTISAGDTTDEIVQINSSMSGNGAIQLNADNSSIIVTRGGNVALDSQFGTINVNARLTSTEPCATGYTRKTPNYCAADTQPSQTGLVRDTCTGIATPDANAKMLQIELDFLLESSGSPVAVTRTSSFLHYPNSTCAGSSNLLLTKTTQQRSADANGLTLLGTEIPVTLVTNTSGFFYVIFNDDAGNSNITRYQIVGYYD